MAVFETARGGILREGLAFDYCDVAVVTKGPAIVSPDEVAGRAAGITVPIVMTDTAWVDFRVTSYPFLVLVEPHTRRILGESVGFGWSDAAALIDAGVGR